MFTIFCLKNILSKKYSVYVLIVSIFLSFSFLSSYSQAQDLEGESNGVSGLVGGCKDSASVENGGSGAVDHYSDSSVCMGGSITQMSSKSGLYYDTAFKDQPPASAPSGVSGGGVGISTTSEYCEVDFYNVGVSFSNCQQIEVINAADGNASDVSYNMTTKSVTSSSDIYSYEDACNINGLFNGVTYGGDRVVLASGETNRVGVDENAFSGTGDAAFFNYPFNASSCMSKEGFDANASDLTCVSNGISTANYTSSLNAFCKEAEDSTWKGDIGSSWSGIYSMCTNSMTGTQDQNSGFTYETCDHANDYVQSNPNTTITPMTNEQVQAVCDSGNYSQYPDMVAACLPQLDNVDFVVTAPNGCERVEVSGCSGGCSVCYDTAYFDYARPNTILSIYTDIPIGYYSFAGVLEDYGFVGSGKLLWTGACSENEEACSLFNRIMLDLRPNYRWDGNFSDVWEKISTYSTNDVDDSWFNEENIDFLAHNPYDQRSPEQIQTDISNLLTYLGVAVWVHQYDQ